MPREPMNTTYIENTTMERVINSLGNHTQYAITPNENYVLHDKRLDDYNYDVETGEPIGEPIALGYYPTTRTVSVNYDFDNVVVGTDGNTTVNKVGEYELYAILRSEVPADQIYSGGNNDHEIA